MSIASPVAAASAGVTAPAAFASRPPVSGSERLFSLDAYRGLIMVTLAFHGFGLKDTALNQLKGAPESGFWQAVYYQFEHVEWIGCSYWDLIQPSFMFMVGVSMAYSYVKRQREGQSWSRMFAHASGRALVLIGLGIFLISNSKRSTEWMLTNVLTQIGLGYAFLFLLWQRSLRTHIITAIALLAGTTALYLSFGRAGVDLARGAPEVSVPAAWAQQHLANVPPAWHKGANIGHALDTQVLNLLPRREPFRFNVGGYVSLNFLPSLATMLFGLMCGELLRSARDSGHKLRVLLAAGVAALGLGLVLSWGGIPLVKRIWTPSFAVFSTGWCVVILATLYWVLDIKHWRGWSLPLVVVGMNSIAIYCLHMTLSGWTAKTLQTHLGENVFKVFGAAYAPMVQATLVGLVFWAICWGMYRRKIFLRI